MREYYDSDEDIPKETLEAVRPALTPESDRFAAPSPSPVAEQKRLAQHLDPGDTVLIHNLGGSSVDYTHFLHGRIESSSEEPQTGSSAMREHTEDTLSVAQPVASSTEQLPSEEVATHMLKIDPVISEATPNTENTPIGVATTVPGRADGSSDTQDVKTELASRVRVHSSHEDLAEAATEPEVSSSRGQLGWSLKLQTSSIHDHVNPVPGGESITASPILAKHAIALSPGTAEPLRPLDPTSPAPDGTPNSPHNERLPSFYQLTSNLPALAEAATQIEAQNRQGYSHHHSHSFGSTASQSPILIHHPYPASAQTSPAEYSNYAASASARSPTSTISELPQYGSPTRYQPYGYYANRRSSAATESGRAMPASLPSASSSGESHERANSSTDGYSTAHTTPIDQPPTADSTPRPGAVSGLPTLPPPNGIPVPPGCIMIPGGYRCDFAGCQAAPFQTQYLLSSHKNVHSQIRPHYCPVPTCSRSEGGKGFKRKNEMIRHGLVHNSPGYICPFCPDKEHRYPRPDNLQRHVRVHHVDKDRDDPALRDVLAQRTEGQGKQRRRRTNGVQGT